MKILVVLIAMFFGYQSLSADVSSREVFTDQEITWLAKNVYFEARNQGIAGQLAVAMVTMNRVADRRFPNTIREVVTQGYKYKSGQPIRNKCHFSWYCDGKSDKIKDWESYNRIHAIILTYLQTRAIIFDITEGATHYHADYVLPDWASTKEKTIEIEDHIFYRWN